MRPALSSKALVLRDAADPNVFAVSLGWHDLDQARAFTDSANFPDGGHLAGVVRLLEIRFLNAAC